MDNPDLIFNENQLNNKKSTGSHILNQKKEGKLSLWIDSQARTLFIFPAVFLILVFSVFPLVSSLLISFTRIRPRMGGYQIRWVGFKNYEKLFFGSEQDHLIGTIEGGMSVLGGIVLLIVTILMVWWLYLCIKNKVKILGIIGRFITAISLIAFTCSPKYSPSIKSVN